MVQTSQHDELLRRARVRPHLGPDQVRLRLSPSNLFMTFIASVIVFGLIGVVACVVATSLVASGHVPGLWIVLGGAVILGLSFALAWRRYSAEMSGHDDLIIDRVSNTLTLPQTFGRTEPLTIRLSDIVSIAPAMEPAKERSIPVERALIERRYIPIKLIVDESVPDYGFHQNMCFAVVVIWRDGEEHERMDPIVDWYSHPRINALAHWLCLQCGISVIDPHE